MAAEYVLTDYTGVPDLVRQFVDLNNVAFSDYEGAMQFGYDWGEWYLQRPGMNPRLCQAALAGEQMVSQVQVTVQELQLGGELLRCGIVDSVATRPEHRQRGLARALMERAHTAMRELADVDAAVLYTNPADHPYRFYGRLGYLTRAQAALVAGPRPDVNPTVEPVDAGEHAQALVALLNDYYCNYEGYAPLDEELWRWHKVEAPESNAMVVNAAVRGQEAVATVSFAEGEILLGGQRRQVTLAYDLAATELSATSLAALLAAAPRDWVAMIVDERSTEMALARALGWQSQVGEVAMVLPFSPKAHAALQRPCVVWYPMIESLIGV